MKRALLESKKNLEIAVVKCLTKAKLNPTDLQEICATTHEDLMRDHGCDLYMAEQVMLHAKGELFRLRAQNLYTRFESPEFDGGYPKKPYTRTFPIKEDHRRRQPGNSEPGRMLDYGHEKSDSDEGYMFKSSLRNLAVDSYRLHQMMRDGDDLPSWCEYKIAQAQSMVQSVRNYLEYKLERMGEDPVGEEEMFDADEMAQDFGEDSVDYADDRFHEEETDETPENVDAVSFGMGYMAGRDPSLGGYDYSQPEETDVDYEEYDDDAEEFEDDMDYASDDLEDIADNLNVSDKYGEEEDYDEDEYGEDEDLEDENEYLEDEEGEEYSSDGYDGAESL